MPPCFNPRARAGRDSLPSLRSGRRTVSIHAPARGATATRLAGVPAKDRFNPRARAGRDLSSPSAPASSQGFNPRARAGRDVAQPAALPPLQVSIHAPARGATCRSRASPSYGGVSIHAPARGATLTVPDLTAPDMFQSTRPRGARLHAPRHDRFRTKFQSTRPRGARPMRRLPSAIDDMFQSTRPRGARPRASCGQPGPWNVSIHAPARGATQTSWLIHAERGFQSTRPRGARPG